MLFNQKQIIDQAKFSYCPLGEAFEKQTEKQVDAINYLKPFLDKTNKIKKIENISPKYIVKKMINNKLRKLLIYKTILN